MERTPMHSIELLHPALPELIDALLRRNRWSWQALERGAIKVDDQVLDIDSLQWWLINADPVLWVETNLVNKPEDGGGLWQLFPYQKPSIRTAPKSARAERSWVSCSGAVSPSNAEASSSAPPSTATSMKSGRKSSG